MAVGLRAPRAMASPEDLHAILAQRSLVGDAHEPFGAYQIPCPPEPQHEQLVSWEDSIQQGLIDELDNPMVQLRDHVLRITQLHDDLSLEREVASAHQRELNAALLQVQQQNATIAKLAHDRQATRQRHCAVQHHATKLSPHHTICAKQ